MLKQFIESGENLKVVETTLQVSREQEGKVEHQRKLLTIAQMREQGFSQFLGVVYVLLKTFFL